MAMLTFFARLIQFGILTYVMLAVLYTTHYIFISPIAGFLMPGGIGVSSPYPLSTQQQMHSPSRLMRPDHEVQYGSNIAYDALTLPPNPSDELWPADLSTRDAQLHFPVSELVSRLGMDHAVRTPITEATLLGKAFAGAMHPTRIIPFYYRATGGVDEGDVTITTLVTSNRFRVFKQLVERYQGPISVTIHIPFPAHSSLSSLSSSHPSVGALRRLHALYTSSPLFATYVDVHLALSPFAASARARTRGGADEQGGGGEGGEEEGEGEGGRQFNVWRNTARLFARTEFVMMLDVDFAVCTDWRGAIRAAVAGIDSTARPGSGPYLETGGRARDGRLTVGSQEVVQRLRDGTAALVVPAFEYVRQEDGVDQKTFPTDKEVHFILALTALYSNIHSVQSLLRLTGSTPPALTAFHASWAAGHNSTDYGRYYATQPGSGEVYKVSQYQSAYEPYVIVSKRVSWCDERFTGYGANKAACLFEMYLSGVSFYVLADHFVIHQSHTYEEQARREERKYNRKLYADFKEEACLRYVTLFAYVAE
ncbi:hypothetical protein AcV7_000060 [Taiwanofungus camphoratus]|nr:hypothetical protein AcV7_000060 [Antrodia cinnamomea]